MKVILCLHSMKSHKHRKHRTSNTTRQRLDAASTTPSTRRHPSAQPVPTSTYCMSNLSVGHQVRLSPINLPAASASNFIPVPRGSTPVNTTQCRHCPHTTSTNQALDFPCIRSTPCRHRDPIDSPWGSCALYSFAASSHLHWQRPCADPCQ